MKAPKKPKIEDPHQPLNVPQQPEHYSKDKKYSISQSFNLSNIEHQTLKNRVDETGENRKVIEE
jgi:hypothetical protein